MNDFVKTEAFGGVLVLMALTIALLWANGPFGDSYDSFWHTDMSVSIGGHTLTLDLRHLVNDLLMALFFFVIGLEVKREVTTGELRKPAQAALPIIAAIGGMVLPAAVYLAFNAGTDAANGWAVPMATDIAIALGVLSLVARRAARGLKSFLLTLAVVDDIAAIIVIAVFFTDGLTIEWLLMSALLISLMVMAWRVGFEWLPGFVVAGLLVWLAVYQSGVHPTIAGAVIGLLVPVRPLLAEDEIDRALLNDVSTPKAASETVTIARKSISLIVWLEHRLHPYASYGVLPLFALANGGIDITGDSLVDAASSPVTIGVIAGLVVGKIVGIAGVAWIAARLNFGTLPAGVGTRELIGIGAIAGIGFTVAVFVSELALPTDQLVSEAKVGILVASFLAGAIGALVLRGSRGSVDDV